MPFIEVHPNKTTDQLTAKAHELIDSLKDYNLAAKLVLFRSLHESLEKTITLQGGAIVSVEKEDVHHDD